MLKAKTIAKNIDYGYITMSKDGRWTWWPTKPFIDEDDHWCNKNPLYSISSMSLHYPMSLNPIKIRPAKNWRKSLIKCGEAK